MKSSFLVLGFAFSISATLFISCNTSEGETETGATESTHIQDSVRLAEIDTLVTRINEGVAAQGEPFKFELPYQAPNDTLSYWMVEGEPRRISFLTHPPQSEVWPTFFVKDKSMLMVRFREWLGGEPPIARETFTYYRGDTVFFARQRKMDLTPGELPARLRLEEFHELSWPFQEITDLYDPYWETVRDTLYKHLIEYH